MFDFLGWVESGEEFTCVGDAYTIHEGCKCVSTPKTRGHSARYTKYRSWKSDRKACHEWCTKDPACVGYFFDYRFTGNEYCKRYMQSDTSGYKTTSCGKKGDRCAIRKGCKPTGQKDQVKVKVHISGGGSSGGEIERRRRDAHTNATNTTGANATVSPAEKRYDSVGISIDDAGSPGVFAEKAMATLAKITGVSTSRLINGNLRAGSIIFEADVLAGVAGDPTPAEAAAKMNAFLADGNFLVIGEDMFDYNISESQAVLVNGTDNSSSFFSKAEIPTPNDATVDVTCKPDCEPIDLTTAATTAAVKPTEGFGPDNSSASNTTLATSTTNVVRACASPCLFVCSCSPGAVCHGTVRVFLQSWCGVPRPCSCLPS